MGSACCGRQSTEIVLDAAGVRPEAVASHVVIGGGVLAPQPHLIVNALLHVAAVERDGLPCSGGSTWVALCLPRTIRN